MRVQPITMEEIIKLSTLSPWRSALLAHLLRWSMKAAASLLHRRNVCNSSFSVQVGKRRHLGFQHSYNIVTTSGENIDIEYIKINFLICLCS